VHCDGFKSLREQNKIISVKKLKKMVKKEKIPMNVNQHPKYAIIDESGKVLDTFRLISTAQQASYYYKRYFLTKVKIVEI
jgi:hypothetical protein